MTKLSKLCHWWCMVIALSVITMSAQAGIKQTLEQLAQVNAQSAASQKEIDQLASQIQRLRQQYRSTVRQTQQLKVYNKQLAAIVSRLKDRKSQMEGKIDAVKTQLENINAALKVATKKQVQTIAQSMPVNRVERLKKARQTQKNIASSSLPISKKMPLVISQYNEALRYANTIEGYNGQITIAGEKHPARFLRLGRLALYFVTADNAMAGYYSTEKAQFIILSESAVDSIRHNLDIIQNKAPPQMIRVLIPAPRVMTDTAGAPQ